jgi:hypothetical protein
MPMVAHSCGVASASARHDEQTRHSKRGALPLDIHTVSGSRQFQNISAMISRESRLNGKVEAGLAVALSIVSVSIVSVSRSSAKFRNSGKSKCFPSTFVCDHPIKCLLVSSQGMLNPDMEQI